MPKAVIVGVEKQHLNGSPPAAYTEWHETDILSYLQGKMHDRVFFKYDRIIGNPPFYLFEQGYIGEWFQQMKRCLRPNGKIILFGRFTVVETAGRWDDLLSWWNPSDITQYVKRVSFYPEGHPRCGKTNARSHALFVWEDRSTKMDQNYITRFHWEPRALNDNNDTIEHPFKGKITWQDMIAMGLVSSEAEMGT